MFRLLPMVLVFMLAPSAFNQGVARPWKPNIHVPACDAIGKWRPDLDQKARKRFLDAYRQGTRLLRHGHYHAALSALDRAIRLNPDHVGARRHHARVLVTLGYLTWNRSLVKKAQADVRHALGIKPEDRDLVRLTTLIDGLLKRVSAATRRRSKR